MFSGLQSCRGWPSLSPSDAQQNVEPEKYNGSFKSLTNHSTHNKHVNGSQQHVNGSLTNVNGSFTNVNGAH
eukprot:5321956-Heterocapsa_arctica.AAC.1